MKFLGLPQSESMMSRCEPPAAGRDIEVLSLHGNTSKMDDAWSHSTNDGVDSVLAPSWWLCEGGWQMKTILEIWRPQIPRYITQAQSIQKPIITSPIKNLTPNAQPQPIM